MVDKTVEKSEPPLKERLASRKFIWANILQIIWLGMFWMEKLSEPGFLTLTQLTVGAYLLANVGDKFAKR